MLQRVHTGSQVCGLAWSQSVNELLSTHGYAQNAMHLWKAPALTNIATLRGHARRVLFLAMSPDGQTAATGAGELGMLIHHSCEGIIEMFACHNTGSVAEALLGMLGAVVFAKLLDLFLQEMRLCASGVSSPQPRSHLHSRMSSMSCAAPSDDDKHHP